MENQVRRLVLVFTLMEYTALFPKRNIRPVTYHSAKKTLIGSRDCIYMLVPSGSRASPPSLSAR